MMVISTHSTPTASAIGLAALLAVGITATARATPRDFQTFGRPQRANLSLVAGDILRIWTVYVGQGDGIVIQLPERFRRSEEPSERPERTDILIDGGSANQRDAQRMGTFLHQLYPANSLEIEYVVITHHDSDHVLGLMRALEDPEIGVGHVFHNGLASFLPGTRKLPMQPDPRKRGVFSKNDSGAIVRWLGLLDDDDAFQPSFVMNDLVDLRHAHEKDQLADVYEQLASSILDKELPHGVDGFHRAAVGQEFIGELEANRETEDPDAPQFEVLWPPDTPRKYGSNWGETINGNSVAFRLCYRDFEMLFTGDVNEASEQALLDILTKDGGTDSLRADVLKAPHHASVHSIESFMRAVAPVVSVASMGPEGARSKALSGRGAWQHPGSDTIRWLGGAHRVYLTELQERRFDWDSIDTVEQLEALRERTHVLVETDGYWFRVVEVPSESEDPGTPPTVVETKPGDGTRWIRAR